MVKSKVYLVGAGPGDPELLTLKALRLLKKADVIINDCLVSKKILKLAKKGTRKILVEKISSLHADKFACDQEKINKVLIKYAQQGKRVVRLKSGDPYVFGRGGQESEALAKAGIPYEVIPGVTSGIAAANLARVPLTDRRLSSSVSLITGHEAPDKLKSLIDWKTKGTLVFYMGVETLPLIVKQLVKNGRKKETPVLVVENVSLRNQRITEGTLKDIATKARMEKIIPPAIIIVGEVVNLRKKLCQKRS